MSKMTTLDQMRDAALRSQGLCAQVAWAASDAVEELDRAKADAKHTHKTEDVAGAATMDQVTAAIQAAVLDSWEGSY